MYCSLPTSWTIYSLTRKVVFKAWNNLISLCPSPVGIFAYLTLLASKLASNILTILGGDL